MINIPYLYSSKKVLRIHMLDLVDAMIVLLA